MNGAFTFVGRESEITRLRRLHEQRKPVLLLGNEGVGKTALVKRVQEELRLLVCPASERLSDICEAMEQQLGLAPNGEHLIPRKNEILRILQTGAHTVVFDGVAWTTPKLARFVENVCARVPVWLCARSEHPWDIGRIWPLLVRFERVKLEAFHLAQTRLLVETAVAEGKLPAKAAELIDWLQRRSAGNPKVLCELLAEMVRGNYDLGSAHGLQLLALDKRIHEMFPDAFVDRKAAVNE